MNILYIIDSLGRGGAEKILVNTIRNLPRGIKPTVVYLNSPSCLIDELSDVNVICLGYTGFKSLLSSVLRLRQIIKELHIDIIHAHLYYSTIISRMACPSAVKLFYSVHSIFSLDVFQNNKLLLFLEKLTYRKSQTPLFVSNSVKQDYHQHVQIKGSSYVLYNFVEKDFFLNKIHRVGFHKPVRLVAVGNLKSAKNYPYLINVFKDLKESPVTLDIYGEGPCRQELEEMLQSYQIENIRLLGARANIAELLGQYDAFIMSSKNEGFCIAVAEAMATGLPCILSDISTFKEVSDEKAVFFDLSDPKHLAHFLKDIGDHKDDLLSNAEGAYLKAQDFRCDNYIEKLLRIYNSIE